MRLNLVKLGESWCFLVYIWSKDAIYNTKMNSTTNSTLESIKKIRDCHSVLTESELAELRRCTEGYGWLTDSARKAGLHTNTIKAIMRRGYGTAKIVNKIRNVLLT